MLLFGDVESRSSKALQKKLSGEFLHLFSMLYTDDVLPIDIKDECNTAKALMILEHALYARSTKEKKKIIYYSDKVKDFPNLVLILLATSLYQGKLRGIQWNPQMHDLEKVS